MNKEFLNVIVADNDENTLIFFKNILKELKISIKVQCFSNGKDMMLYLNNNDAVVPEIVFIKYTIRAPRQQQILALRNQKNSW